MEHEEHRDRVAAEALDSVEAHLAAGDVHQARRALIAARRMLGSGSEVAARAHALERRVALCEKLAGPAAAYESARERGDAVAASDHARRAAELAEGDEAHAWRAIAAQCEARRHAEWRIGEAAVDLDAEGALADCAGLCDATEGAAPRALSDAGATAMLVSAHQQWLFLREVDLQRGRLRRIGWLRVPQRVAGWSSIEVHDRSIHMVSEDGTVLELSLRPLDVVRWASLRPFMLPDRVVDHALVVPPGRFVWSEHEDPTEQQTLAVVDLEEQRVCRRPPVTLFDTIVGTDPPRVLGKYLMEETAEMFDERGARIDWQAPPGSIQAVAIHPTGTGWMALVTVPEYEAESDDVPTWLVEMLPGHAPVRTQVLETYLGAPSILGVSLDQQLAFVLTAMKSGRRLSAYRSTAAGLERVWSLHVSSDVQLIQHARGRRVIALAPRATGLAFVSLGHAPPSLPSALEDTLRAHSRWSLLWRCTAGKLGEMERALAQEPWTSKRDEFFERWAEKMRRQHRRNPAALAELVDVLAKYRRPELGESILAFAWSRTPELPRLVLARANLEAMQSHWEAVERVLETIAPSKLSAEHACHLHHLLGMAVLARGDAASAHQHFSEGARIDPNLCEVVDNLEVTSALLEPNDPPPPERGSALRRVIRACRSADARLARHDAAGALEMLDCSVVHAARELQSAARLAEAHLALEPVTSHAIFRKAVALARLVAAAEQRDRDLEASIPGLGWTADHIEAVAARARHWLEAFSAPELLPALPAAPWAATLAPSPPPGADPRAPADGGLDAPRQHALPPAGHETLRALVSGLDAVVRETARYVRALPGWDDTQTLGEDLADLAPVRRFLAGYVDRLEQSGTDPEDALAQLERLNLHLDYCVNFELHRRKLFFADASLAWMLAHTSLHVEGRALRLPFACFGLVFTDRATLDIAEAVRPREHARDGGRLQVFTTYVKRVPAPDGRRSFVLHMVFDAHDGRWPALRTRELCFAEDDDLDDILDSGLPSNSEAPLPDTRRLVHVLLNAILYATSANVAWPLSHSPARRLQARSKKRGKKRKARLDGRAQELRKQYSSEDVFYLPGRIPISQLRVLQQIERDESQGRVLLSRCMVRGHWRRAAPGWRNAHVRWIEPYWKGPELAAIIEKEYKLKI